MTRSRIHQGASLGERLVHHGWVEVQRTFHTPCWEWSSRRNDLGYGTVKVDGKSLLAHRVAYEVWVGPVLDIVRHRCDNPPCINPDHLEPGSQANNIEDRVQRGRNGNNILTIDQVREIRRLYETRLYSQARLGEMFNVCQANVSAIVRNETWRWA